MFRSFPRVGWAMLFTFGALATASGCQQQISLDYAIHVDRLGSMDQPVKETEPFYNGEKFRLRFTSHEELYVYILNKGATGGFRVLFPQATLNGGSSLIEPWKTVMVPAAPGSFQFDAQPGVERMVVCVSRRPVPALDAIYFGQERDSAKIEQSLQQLESDGKRAGHFHKTQYSDHTNIRLDTPDAKAAMVSVINLQHAAK